MSISIVAAVTTDGAIGNKGNLLFHISEDLKNFKRLTMGHPIIMGRKTFESLPGGPLPGRRNIVISRNRDYHPQGVDVFSSLTAALATIDTDTEAMVIGGGQLYNVALPLASRLYLTEIEAVVEEADTYFPPIDPADWSQIATGDWTLDPRHSVRFRFTTLSRV
jgi:dihydrofolate reductase